MDLPFLHMTLAELIRAVGYLGVFVAVFLESGVPIGALLPLPGDTLLFSAGLLASASAFDLLPLLATIIAAAILGDSAGYWFGATFGPKLFTKEKALFLNKNHLARTERFYARYGRRALIFARFIPYIRTLAPIAAGMGRMRYGTFLRYNVVSAFLWGLSVTLLGYFFGKLIPNPDRYLLPVLAVIVIFSSASSAFEFLRARKEAAPKIPE